MKNLFRKICIASVFTMMLPTAFAVEASPVAEIPTVDAQSQPVIMDKIPVKAKNIQLTVNLTKEQAYDFMLNSIFNQPGIELFVKELDEDSVTVYLTSNSSELTSDGRLELGFINSSDVFNIESISDVKVTDGVEELGYWHNIGKSDEESDIPNIDYDDSEKPDDDNSNSSNVSTDDDLDDTNKDDGDSNNVGTSDDGSTDTDKEESDDSNIDNNSSSEDLNNNNKDEGLDSNNSGNSNSSSGGNNSSSNNDSSDISSNNNSSSGSSSGGSSSSGSSSSGSTSNVKKYGINIIADKTFGSVRVDNNYANSGENITIYVDPVDEYSLEQLFVEDKSGREIKSRQTDYDRFVFEMPNNDVVINAIFKKTENPNVDTGDIIDSAVDDEIINKMPFVDVAENDWSYEAIKYVYDNGIMNGISNTLFSPKDNTSRAMLVTMLYRLDNSLIDSQYKSKFSDIDENSYYEDAVKWAEKNNIISGYSSDKFGPHDNITREQLATILYRYAKYKNMNLDYEIAGSAKFDDIGVVNEYAVNTVNWAISCNIIQGVNDNKLDPQGFATREQIATIFMRFMELSK